MCVLGGRALLGRDTVQARGTALHVPTASAAQWLTSRQGAQASYPNSIDIDMDVSPQAAPAAGMPDDLN